jgi:hypothetical protein
MNCLPIFAAENATRDFIKRLQEHEIGFSRVNVGIELICLGNSSDLNTGKGTVTSTDGRLKPETPLFTLTADTSNSCWG